MTLEDLIALQAKLGLTDIHLVWIGETGLCHCSYRCRAQAR